MNHVNHESKKGEPMNNTITHQDRAPVQNNGQNEATTFTPRVDIVETGDELVLFADLPGVKPEDVDLKFERGELILHGKVAQRQPQNKFLYSEYGIGDFYRSFAIGEHLDMGRITARMVNGVLEVHLPKTDAVKPRKISVQAQ
jgi:HSP20 family protein